MNNTATIDKVTNEELIRKEWRKKRREKEISLSEIAAFIGCNHAHLSQYELKPNWNMAEDKVQLYMGYIESH